MSGTGVAAIASSRSTSNCYYPDNLDLSDNYAVATPAAAFTDGKVVELLNAGRTGEDAVWGQGENYPVFIPPHTHSWSYELTDAYTITATCDADGCPAPDGGSVTLSQPTNLTYDGSEKDVPPLTYTDWQLGVEAKPTVTYNTVDRANVTGQDITASITMGTGEGAKTVRVSYQVQPRVITDDMVALNPTSFDYDGQEKHPSITVDYDASLLLTENTHYQVSGASATDAGNYTVTVEGMGNYTGTVTKDWSISRKRIEFEVSISSWTFSEIIDPTQTPEVKNNYGNGSVTYWYKVYGADDSTYTQTVPTDAGTYTVKADIDETRNYEGGSATANFVIEQSGAPLVSVVSKKHAYTVASTGNTVNLADMLPPKRGATQYTLQSTTGDYITNVVVDENSGVLTYDTVAMPAPDDTGRIVVSVTMNNYKPTTITIGVEPTDKTVLTVTPPAAVDGVYNAQAHSGYTGAPSAAGYYDAYSIIYTGRNGTVYGPMADAPVNAGEYTVTFSIPADNAYYIGSTSVDFSIAKATPTGEPVVTPIYRDGKTLEDAGLTTVGGTFSVEGTVAWNDPLTTVVEEGKAYGWTFTPNDSGNYEPITGRVVVYPVGDTPVIDEPAEAQTVSAISGSTATMTVAAQGTGKLAYQWYISYDGGKTFEPIPGATQPSYTTSAVKTENNGYQYYCLATSLYGEAKSPVFTLSVVNPAVLPQTGDHSQIGLWMAMCFISIAGILLLRKKPFIR